MCKEIEVHEMYKHWNIIKYAYYWIGEEYGLVLYEGSLHDILHENNTTLHMECQLHMDFFVIELVCLITDFLSL